MTELLIRRPESVGPDGRRGVLDATLRIALEKPRLDRLSRGLYAWPLPASARVSDDWTRLEWRFDPDPRLVSASRADLLSRFLRFAELGLGNKPLRADHFERFAQVWGVFGHHGRPAAGQSGHDDLAQIAQLSAAYWGVLQVAGALQQGAEPTPEARAEAQRLLPGARTSSLYEAMIVSSFQSLDRDSRKLGRVQRRRVQWHALRLMLDQALGRAGVRPMVNLAPHVAPGVEIILGGASLAQALAMELVRAVLGSAGVPCAGCLRLVNPKRPPGRGRASWCTDCRGARAAAHRKRRERERSRRAARRQRR